MCKHQSIFEKQ